jgi:DNA polymerase/3'-5' exonuclease PolX
MTLSHAIEIAERVKALLAPHCERIEISGSIRRRKPDVGDIEIVAIPKPYDVGLFESGIASVVESWPKVRGDLPCKYTQRLLPDGIALDLFFATPRNWGLIYAIRTGSAAYSHLVLARGWSDHGYTCMDGILHRVIGEPSPSGRLVYRHTPVDVPEESDLFRLCGIPWIHPERRSL